MSEPIGCWVDGSAGATLPADDRGLQYGDGLFETLLVRDGRPRFLELHLARLARESDQLTSFVLDFDFTGEIRRMLVDPGFRRNANAPRAERRCNRVLELGHGCVPAQLRGIHP